MICSKCKGEFLEKDVQESHDIPTYLFWGDRKIRKQEADLYKRRWLCVECHKEFEKKLQYHLINEAKRFAEEYFNG